MHGALCVGNNIRDSGMKIMQKYLLRVCSQIVLRIIGCESLVSWEFQEFINLCFNLIKMLKISVIQQAKLKKNSLFVYYRYDIWYLEHENTF